MQAYKEQKKNGKKSLRLKKKGFSLTVGALKKIEADPVKKLISTPCATTCKFYKDASILWKMET